MQENVLQSVDNALKLIELFSEAKEKELGVSEISRSLSLGRSTIHRLLTTLENRNFVERNLTTGKYHLGIKIVGIAALMLGSINIVKTCRPFLEQLSTITGENCHLAILTKSEEIMFIDKVNGSNPAVISSRVGVKLPAYATATGKVLLAYLSQEELENHINNMQFRKLTPMTIANVNELLVELDIIRKQGYGEDRQEAEEGWMCFAAPIWDYSGKVVAAMSVSGSISRVNPKQSDFVEIIQNIATQASHACGRQMDFDWK